MRTRLIWLLSIATALFSASCYANESAAEYKHTNTLKALDFIKQNEIYNPESVIPPQCYTKTEGKHNPCMACHQSYPSTDKRPNILNDGDLQGDYQFSEAGMTNSWTNLFVDRSLKIKDIKDSFISEWVKEDNYHSFINAHKNHPQIEAIKLDNLALPKKAFFENDRMVFTPKVGNWYLFPANLRHVVYPFKCDGERRSFSINMNTNIFKTPSDK